MEEQEAGFAGSLSINYNVGVARSLPIQLPHCYLMGCHVYYRVTVPLGQRA